MARQDYCMFLVVLVVRTVVFVSVLFVGIIVHRSNEKKNETKMKKEREKKTQEKEKRIVHNPTCKAHLRLIRSLLFFGLCYFILSLNVPL